MAQTQRPLWCKGELPSTEEITSQEPIKPLENDISKPPQKKSRYAEIQYSILRHEGTEMLRRSVNDYRNNPTMAETPETRIYARTLFEGLVADIQGISYRVSFTTQRCSANVDWQRCKRLTTGSLVAISPANDNFKTKVFITVITRRQILGGLEPEPGSDHQNAAPRIDIAWSDDEEVKWMLTPNNELVMIQSGSGMWESVRHVLDGLQRWSMRECRFDRYFVDCASDPPTAPLFQHDKAKAVVNVESLILPGKEFPNRDINLTGKIPESFCKATGLDDTQVEAFRMMLTREVSIIQGPPGTGKTFTSVAALRLFLQIMYRSDVVLVSAQTNRALDQLLTHCMNIGANVVRLGSRSREHHIKDRTVRNILMNMNNMPKMEGMRAMEMERKKEVIKLKELIQEIYSEELPSLEQLREGGLITIEQYNSLNPSLLDWDFEDDDFDPDDDDDDDKESEKSIQGSGRNPLIDWLGNKIIETPIRLDMSPGNAEVDDEDIDAPDPYEEDAGFMADDEEEDGSVFIRAFLKWTSKTEKSLEESEALWHHVSMTLKKTKNLNSIPDRTRPFVFKYWQQKLTENNLGAIWKSMANITRLARAVHEARQKRNAKVVLQTKANVLGCTTTGLTKFRTLIEHVGPRILLVEEAAETREANILAAPLASVEQLILVGDHKQLAPHANVRELMGAPYHLRLSLFERLINHKIPYVMLGVQRRMAPKIRSLISPFYDNLRDHEIVHDKTIRPDVPGMGGLDTFWFHHTSGERLTPLKSRDNVTEAEMVVAMFRYLVQNGTAPDKITVLTFYTGQRKIIYNMLATDRKLALLTPGPFNVCTVDAFQGEENDVILLSLVRSPVPQGRWSIGFLDDYRRTVVSLSRARRGLYIFGNYANFMYAKKAQIAWYQSQLILQEDGRQGPKIELTCERHKTKTSVESPEDFARLDGGCRQKCHDGLPCGHECPLLCHSYSHDKVPCNVLCKRKLWCGHECVQHCREECICENQCGRSTAAKYQGMDLDARFEMLELEAEEKAREEKAREEKAREEKAREEKEKKKNQQDVAKSESWTQAVANGDEEEDLISFSDSEADE